PAFYRCISKIYWTFNFHHLTELFIGTKARERQWAARPIAEGYWDNRDHPSKHFFAERIAAFSPIHSILEVGCASGPNLYLLAKRFPQAQIVGIDINQEAVQYGNGQFAREGISNVKLFVGKADKLGEFQDRAFDIVFTNALLIYIGPDKIKEVIEGILRITHHALVLIELHCFEPDDEREFIDVESVALDEFFKDKELWIKRDKLPKPRGPSLGLSPRGACKPSQRLKIELTLI
ncbi:unnamed protein product, partial [marine sediment metagenome]